MAAIKAMMAVTQLNTALPESAAGAAGASSVWRIVGIGAETGGWLGCILTVACGSGGLLPCGILIREVSFVGVTGFAPTGLFP